MRTFLTFLLVLMSCDLHGAQEHSRSDVENDEVLDETQRSWMKDDKKDFQSGIWEELRNLQSLVREQRVELKQLTERVAAADRLVQALQEEMAVMKIRMTAAERRAEELQLEGEAQTAEIQQTISSVQDRVSHTMDQLMQMQLQQEERKVAFSTSLYITSEGNTDHPNFATLVFKNIFTNIGNHYSPITGYFTAPVRGMYYFRFTGHIAHATSSMVLRLVKNEDPTVCSGDRYTTSTDPEDNASNGAVLQLETGDVVSIQMNGMVWDDYYHRTTFSGFLLFVL